MKARSRIAVGFCVAIIATIARGARAEEPAPIALEYETSADARSCGDATLLRSRVAERIGRDPFGGPRSEAQRTLRVRASREKNRWVAEIILADPTGAIVGRKTLSEGGSSCDALSSSLVFTIAVLLEEPRQTEPSPPPPASVPSSTKPEPSPFEPEPPKEAPLASPPAPRVRFDASVGAVGLVGIAPSPSAGFEAVVGLARERLRLELGGRATLPSSGDAALSVRTRLVAGRIAPCYGPPIAAGCIVLTAGSISGEAAGEGVASSRASSTAYAAGGVAVLSRVMLGSTAFVRAVLEATMPFTRPGFDVGTQRVWTLPVVSAAGALSLGVELP